MQPDLEWLSMAWSGPHDQPCCGRAGESCIQRWKVATQRLLCAGLWQKSRGSCSYVWMLPRANQAETVYLVPRAIGYTEELKLAMQMKRRSELEYLLKSEMAFLNSG